MRTNPAFHSTPGRVVFWASVQNVGEYDSSTLALPSLHDNDRPMEGI
jgi:hypothetical protein